MLKTEKLTNSDGYEAEYQLFDGFTRPRQTQVPGPDGTRLVTDTFYNSIGKVAKTNAAYHAAGTPTDPPAERMFR